MAHWRMIMIIAFFITLLGTAKAKGSLSDIDPAMEQEIIDKYPGLFKSDKEIEIIRKEAKITDKQPGILRPVWEKLGSTDLSTSGLKQKITSVLDKKKTDNADTVFHGCCMSDRSFTAFTSLSNIYGNTLTLVQLHKKKQWFEVDSCRTSPNCDSCTCAIETRLYTALVFNPDYQQGINQPVMLDLVKAPTVCRCLNNAPAGRQPGSQPQRLPFEMHDEL